MHVRKLVPLAELLEQMGGGGAPRLSPPAAKASIAPAAKAPIGPTAKPAIAPTKGQIGPAKSTIEPIAKPAIAPASGQPGPTAKGTPNLKDGLLSEIRAGKPFFYNTVIAQAQKIEVADDRVTFTFSPTHRALREQFEQSRSWVETTAERVAGRRVMVESAQGVASAAAPVESSKSDNGGAPKRDLKADAMSSSAIQAVLDVFPAEIRDVEELEP